MKRKGWKATIIILGIGVFFTLWGGLNIWTGRAFNLFGRSKYSYSDEWAGQQFVTRDEYPREFWLTVSFKLCAGTSFLVILGGAHWRRWRRRVHRHASESVEKCD